MHWSSTTTCKILLLDKRDYFDEILFEICRVNTTVWTFVFMNKREIVDKQHKCLHWVWSVIQYSVLISAVFSYLLLVKDLEAVLNHIKHKTNDISILTFYTKKRFIMLTFFLVVCRTTLIFYIRFLSVHAMPMLWKLCFLNFNKF